MKLRPWLAALVALPFSTSCSLMFVDGPKPVDQRGGGYAPTCTTSSAWPVVDVLLTGNYAINAIYFSSLSDDELKAKNLPRGAAVGGSVALAALALTSAVVGFNRVNECRAQEESAPRAAYRYPRSQPVAPRAVQRQEEAEEEAAVQAQARARFSGAGSGLQGLPPAAPAAPAPSASEDN